MTQSLMGDLIDVTLTNEDVKLVSVEVGIEESVGDCLMSAGIMAIA